MVTTRDPKTGQLFDDGVARVSNVVNGGWEPSDLANIHAWYRADDARFYGGLLNTGWLDNITPATMSLGTVSTIPPKMGTGNPAFNKRTTVDFTTLNSEFVKATSSAKFVEQGYSVFILTSVNSLGGTRALADLATIASGAMYVTGTSGFPAMNAGTVLTATSALSIGDAHLCEFYWNNPSSQITVNGVIAASGATGIPTAGGLILGGLGDESNTHNGEIAECIILTSELGDSSTDYFDLMVYLNSRYGLSLPLTRT